MNHHIALPSPEPRRFGSIRLIWACLTVLWLNAMPMLAQAQGFDKLNTTVGKVQAILVTVAVAVVTIAIMWAGYKMIFQGARLADVSNVLIGGTLIGGASAFGAFIVN